MPISNRNPMNMAPEDIVQEINSARDTIEGASRRIYELSRTLHARMRRTSSSTDVGVYVTYANVWTRFAGMVQQGLRRTQQADRVLRLLQDEDPSVSPADEAPAPPPPEETDEAHSMPTESSPYEDLIAVYGEELVSDADRQQRR